MEPDELTKSVVRYTHTSSVENRPAKEKLTGSLQCLKSNRKNSEFRKDSPMRLRNSLCFTDSAGTLSGLRSDEASGIPFEAASQAGSSGFHPAWGLGGAPTAPSHSLRSRRLRWHRSRSPRSLLTIDFPGIFSVFATRGGRD